MGKRVPLFCDPAIFISLFPVSYKITLLHTSSASSYATLHDSSICPRNVSFRPISLLDIAACIDVRRKVEQHTLYTPYICILISLSFSFRLHAERMCERFSLLLADLITQESLRFRNMTSTMKFNELVSLRPRNLLILSVILSASVRTIRLPHQRYCP